MAKPVTRTHIMGTTVATAVALTLVLVTMVAPAWQGYKLQDSVTGKNGTLKYGIFYNRLCVPTDECKAQPRPETWDWSGLRDNILKANQLSMAYTVLEQMLLFCLLTVCLVLEVRALRTSSWSHSATGLVMMAFSTTACVQWSSSVRGTIGAANTKMKFDDSSVSSTIHISGKSYRITGTSWPWNHILLGISAVLTTVMALFFMSRFMASYPAQTEDNELTNPNHVNRPGEKEQVPGPNVYEQSVSL